MSALYMIASSNEYNSGYSFSPSELYVDKEGNCFEETYHSRLNYEKGNIVDAMEPTCHIKHYYEGGYWNVSGKEIKERFESHKFDPDT